MLSAHIIYKYIHFIGLHKWRLAPTAITSKNPVDIIEQSRNELKVIYY